MGQAGGVVRVGAAAAAAGAAVSSAVFSALTSVLSAAARLSRTAGAAPLLLVPLRARHRRRRVQLPLLRAPAATAATAATHPQRLRRGVRIYTRTGDGGTSALFTGERRVKYDAVFEGVGSVDELNAHLGVVRGALDDACATRTQDEAAHLRAIVADVADIQTDLIDVGASLATPLVDASSASSSCTPDRALPGARERVAARLRERTLFPSDRAAVLERRIDEMEGVLPPLRQFILPGGGAAAAQLHVARAVARRAERSVVAFRDRSPAGSVDPSVLAYLNRLSDYLFVAARLVAQLGGSPEHAYRRRNSGGGSDETERRQ